MQRLYLLSFVILSTLNHQLSTALAQSTAFTYQGRLNNGGNPANGVRGAWPRLIFADLHGQERLNH